MNKEIEIPEGYQARITGNKVIIEQKDSEDEKIRKTLIYIVKGAYSKYGIKYRGYKISEKILLDYLEKQKSVQSDTEKQYVRTLESLISDFLNGKQEVDRDYYQQICDWLEERHIEEKPESCDCSRDEESYTNGIHHVLMNPEAYGLIKQKPVEQLGGTFTSYDIAKTFTEGQNYVIAHPEKFDLCKPAECSEEDDALLKEIVSFFKDGTVKLQHDLNLYAGFLEKKLKSLRPQPHWKPSEEQMRALENVIKCEVSAGLHVRAEIIQSLLNDLKKL